MLTRKLYYHLKPFIPRSIQITLRRMIIRRKRKLYGNIWPIDEKAGRPPEGWTGWPDGKKFALVLMHDVDTEKGHEKCLELMQLDEQMGFRSSFNFVPERYQVSPELRRILAEKGFEVAVHGLKHDGMLFSSRKTFLEQAVRINQYLRDWQSVGFVSPSMHRNLEWIHDLNVKYDASTFDTDPFEPQPDGVGTIFPFWVSASGSATSQTRGSTGHDLQPVTCNPQPEFHCFEPGTRNPKPETVNYFSQPATSNLQPPTVLNHGYIELPYTLPQDFTLFVIMGEKSIDIWKKKLDWIVQNGGMALLITHPDYMNFSDRPKSIQEYPVEHYMEFLEYIKREYSGQYWNVLPREITAFRAKVSQVRTNEQISPYPLARKNHVVFIVENNSVPYDIRVWREARAVKAVGWEVSVICRQDKGAKFSYEQLAGIDIYRHPSIQWKTGQGSFVIEYVVALFWELYLSLRIYLRRPFRVIHAANPPDMLFFVGVLYRTLGVKYIFDLHDLTPELYLSKFRPKGKWIYRSLVLLEKLSCKLASVIIATNESYAEQIKKRHRLNNKSIVVVRNDPELAEFCWENRELGSNTHTKLRILYLGSINKQDGVQILIDALKYLVFELKVRNFMCTIVGEGESLAEAQEGAKVLGLGDLVEFTGVVRDRRKVQELLRSADICVEPAPSNEVNQLSTFIKIMEYMAVGKPVVAFDLKETRVSADGAAMLATPGDVKEFAEMLRDLIREPKLREALGQVGRNRTLNELNWEKAASNLSTIYLSLQN